MIKRWPLKTASPNAKKDQAYVENANAVATVEAYTLRKKGKFCGLAGSSAPIVWPTDGCMADSTLELLEVLPMEGW